MVSSVYDAGSTVNDDFGVMDDYQGAGADMTSAFSDTSYQDTSAEIPITQLATHNGVVDEKELAILNRYDTDGDGHISRDEYNKAMVDLGHKTDTLTSVMQMVSETAAKISDSLMSVSKFF